MSDELDVLDPDAQERRSADQAKLAKTALDDEAADFRWLMSSRRGRAMVARLLDQCAVPTGDPFSTNALTMSRNLGLQETGRRILALVQTHCFDLYAQMMREAVK